jgi:hypothetical protein
MLLKALAGMFRGSQGEDLQVSRVWNTQQLFSLAARSELTRSASSLYALLPEGV